MVTETVVAGAREEVLHRIRVALKFSTDDEAVVGAEYGAVTREYKRDGTLGRATMLEMLEDRLRDYDAHVIRAKVGGVGAAIAKILGERGKRRLVVPQGLVEALGEALPVGFEFVADKAMTTSEIDSFEGVLTASSVAIAETGTIILQNVPGQGRRAPTLIPDYHLCVVRAADVVETVPEAMDRIAGTATLAMTFFSGPSATADIEMTRIKGVHGPRFLDVILVD
jgi:L-lactate dehydrogenase complex protein LldG